MNHTRNVIVLHSLGAPDGPTKYAVQMRDGAPPEITTKFFSWKNAIFGRYDVFHVHWPEYLLRHRRPLFRAAQLVLYCLFLARLSVFRTPVVRTLHNTHPHEGSSALERRLLSLLDRRTNVFIRLNPTTEDHKGKPTQTIPHGHYVDRFESYEKPAPIKGRLLYFGLIRPYKGVEELLSVFTPGADEDLSLRIVGKPLDRALGERIEDRVHADSRVTADLRFVDDEQLVREFSTSELVVLPYREMHNSGVLLVSISLSRPVLVPETPSNRWLADEIGSEWIMCYRGDISMKLITTAMERARETLQSGKKPELAGRSWSEVGQRHAAVYRSALSSRRDEGW